ncbi:MAG: SpoIIE family protein phosphatase [Christensenella sp.]|nr:SpoIIE family protein phosphatase [Christensenella sp.]
MKKQKRIRKLKTIFRSILAISMAGMLAVTLVGCYFVISAIYTKNIRDIVRGEFDYIGSLIDHTLSDENAGNLWLENYTIGEDDKSFVYTVMSGAVINGTNCDELYNQLSETGSEGITLETIGLDVDIKALEQTEEPAWLTMPDGEEYAIYAQKYDDWDLIIGVSRSYLYAEIPLIAIMVTCIFIVLFLVLYLVLSKFLEHKIIRSMECTNQSLEKITQGDLNEKATVDTSVEFQALSQGINTTVDSLKDAIQRAEAAAWMERELSIASEIQLACMPKLMNHSLEEDHRFRLFADMKTAKEVGGDFYDYFVVGENKLGFVIADVSGKGIPAAMFMMSAKTYIKLYMEQGGNLADAFCTVNQKLCENNEVEMFVTVFAGVIDLQNGMLRYVNAGHNPSALLREGAVTWLKERSGPLIGMIEQAKYKELSLQLKKGDLLCLYTDGVTEAMNPQKELFGTQRLADILKETSGQPLAKIGEILYGEITAFEQGAQRADDITMLLLRLEGENQ